MATISQEYLDKLPPIYRDIMEAFPAMEPQRRAGYGLAYQTIYEHVRTRDHSLGEIILACQQMSKAGVVVINNNIFVHPTPTGEQIIAAVTSSGLATPLTVPDFPTPPE